MASTGLTAFNFATYFVMGLTLTVLGPVIPDMSESLGVGYGAFGMLFVLNSLCYLPAVLLGGFACHTLGTKRVYAMGLTGLVLGYGLVGVSHRWGMVLVGSALAAGGVAVVEAALNALTLSLGSTRRGAALNVLHVFAALGAMAGPLSARWLVSQTGQWQVVFLFMAIVGGVLVACLPRLVFPSELSEAPPSMQGMGRLMVSPVLLLLGLGMLLYVGAEMGLSNWMYSYWVEVLKAPEYTGALLNSLFWAGLGLGRLLAAPISERVGYARFTFWSSALSVTLLFPGLMLREESWVLLSFFGTGVAFSGMFPTLLALGGRLYPDFSGGVTGSLIFYAGLGGMLFPAGMGYTAQLFGVRTAMALAFGSALGLVVVTAILAYRLPINRQVAPLEEVATSYGK